VENRNLILYENINQCVTLSGVAAKKGRRPTEADLGVISNASAVVDAEKDVILWIGPAADVPEQYEDVFNRYSSHGEIWLPELVECHTHLIFAGNRFHDYALRCKGVSYLDIAKQGGGILSTLEHTRKASLEELKENALAEIDRFQKYGIGTIEVKTGYGLDLETELRMLECVRELADESSVRLIPTFLPAHATPPEFKGRTDEYVDVICKEWIPEVAERKLAVFFDAFIEEGYFSVAQARKMGEVAKDHGLKIKFHTDQFNDLGGTPLGVELGAQSVDHLDQISESSIAAVAASETVAVVCPGASMFTGTTYPPARKLIDAGARVAITTDYNPGTCPSRNLPLMTTIACSQMKMTIPEAIAGITYNAAAALGIEDEYGSLQVGRPFRVCQLKADSYEVLPYCFGELE